MPNSHDDNGDMISLVESSFNLISVLYKNEEKIYETFEKNPIELTGKLFVLMLRRL